MKVSARSPGLDKLFAHVEEAPPDPILGTALAYKADTDSRKVNLGIGAYRTEQGKPYVLPVVMRAEQDILNETGKTIDKEYSTIDGPPELKAVTQKILFGDNSKAVNDGRVASVQALSGTGALRVAGEFIKTHMNEACHTIYVSDPTWGNHNAIFKKAGMTVKTYPYYNPAQNNLNIDGMLKALSEAPAGSTILLHACAHNPTGVDPTTEQWKQIADLMKKKKLVPLLDCAYQGYASGDLDRDAATIRFFESQGFEMFVCQSFAKNLGLYGERIGMLHVISSDASAAKCVLSQLKLVIRPMYSSPPIHGAHLLIKILGDQARFQQWKMELKDMADRVLDVRKKLRDGLEKKTGTKWNHITDQIGMFSFTGLTAPQCERLIKEHHIYLLKSGRISLAGINNGNVSYVVDCIAEVVKTVPK